MTKIGFHRRRMLAFVSAFGIVLTLATPAAAQVFVDPDGPAGKQYSDSLDEARAKNSESDPAGAVPGSGQAPPPLFGEGVTPAGQSPQGPGGGPSSEPATSTGAEAGNTAGIGDGGGSIPMLVLIVGGAVALGALGGFVLSRSTRHSEA